MSQGPWGCDRSSDIPVDLPPAVMSIARVQPLVSRLRLQCGPEAPPVLRVTSALRRVRSGLCSR
jgi:hypothetical protein